MVVNLDNQNFFVSSQVILVQVNPGEAFTIRREDGQYQCITGMNTVLLLHVYLFKIWQIYPYS